jgi:uncharacterized protein (TIGR02246 family)
MASLSARAAAAVILAFVFSPAIVPNAHGQSSSSDADSAAIRKTIDSFLAAFNRHDAKAWAAPFTEDGDFTNVTGLTRHGRKEIEERFAGLFAGPLKDTHRTCTVRHIRFLTPEIAAVDADWELVGSKASDGSENPVRKGLFTWVMTKQNGQWLFAVFHESEFAVAR